ncbi:hypothetical protein [Azohydromonas aeria]|uniref:hypothetical protein n=1 Tax=Azohydromonas aeria TaxID=2590212 RepID=UPI0012F743BA|nr:hypothetical protein [Azohydromonas aeria]
MRIIVASSMSEAFCFGHFGKIQLNKIAEENSTLDVFFRQPMKTKPLTPVFKTFCNHITIHSGGQPSHIYPNDICYPQLPICSAPDFKPALSA